MNNVTDINKYRRPDDWMRDSLIEGNRRAADKIEHLEGDMAEDIRKLKARVEYMEKHPIRMIAWAVVCRIVGVD